MEWFEDLLTEYRKALHWKLSLHRQSRKRPADLRYCLTDTSKDSNIILSNAFEYRAPSQKAEAMALEQLSQTGETRKADMTSRFMGLVVIPKHQIVKIELEERRSEPVSQELPVRQKE